jgi:hypothetical protein
MKSMDDHFMYTHFILADLVHPETLEKLKEIILGM